MVFPTSGARPVERGDGAGAGLPGWEGIRSLAGVVPTGPRTLSTGVAAVLWVAATVGILELALWSTSAPGSPAVARGFDGIFRACRGRAIPISKLCWPRLENPC